jgi:hypothetical protein
MRSALDPFHVEFAADKMALGQVFLRVIHFSLISTIPPNLHTVGQVAQSV